MWHDLLLWNYSVQPLLYRLLFACWGKFVYLYRVPGTESYRGNDEIHGSDAGPNFQFSWGTGDFIFWRIHWIIRYPLAVGVGHSAVQCRVSFQVFIFMLLVVHFWRVNKRQYPFSETGDVSEEQSLCSSATERQYILYWQEILFLLSCFPRQRPLKAFSHNGRRWLKIS